jgi:hypothetical protein
MIDSPLQQFSNTSWLSEDPFRALSLISRALTKDEFYGRQALVRALEHQEVFEGYSDILGSLVHQAGLQPYLALMGEWTGSTADQLDLEFHTVDGLEDVVLHSMQGRVYRTLCDGTNVILSAPTSFGKSLLIDAMIASGRFDQIVVIVPTIALIDETRRRLARRFGTEYKVVTHPGQSPGTRNIYVLTQERFLEFEKPPQPQFFVLDEFYKLSPKRGDDRTFILNQAFYELYKSGAQFFLIGPNIRDITIDEHDLDFRYFRTDFSTIATEVHYSRAGSPEDNVLDICKGLKEPTLIFCKSAPSAYKLASFLRSEGVSAAAPETREMADWLRANIHSDWILADLLDDGFAVHHGGLPRSIAYHLLRKFNDGEIRFLLCTSTIIEGVNTAAKHIIIYDNKIATKKFDQFTFNNIKGRAGRMFRHFVGHVYVLHPEPHPQLPLVDFPAITQPDDVPESLLIQLEDRDLSDESRDRLRYIHAQTALPVDVIRSNTGVDPIQQVKLAEEIGRKLETFRRSLVWTGYPTSEELEVTSNLIFDFLMDGKGKDGVYSGRQLWFKINQYRSAKGLKKLVELELNTNRSVNEATDAVEAVFQFLRRWCEFSFPRYLTTLDKIQRHVFTNAGIRPGNYEAFALEVKNMFMPPAAAVLEEYGMPFQLTLKIERIRALGDAVDEILGNLRKIDPQRAELLGFELEMLKETVENL